MHRRRAEEFFHHPVQRPVERQREDKVAAAVRQVIGDARDPHGKKAFPASVDGEPLEIHQRPEHQAEHRRDHRPEKGGVVFAEGHRDRDQQRPGVEIAEPPDPAAEDQSLEHDVDSDGIHRPPAEEDRREDEDHGVEVDVRDRGESRLCGKEQRAQERKGADLPGRELTSRS